MRLSSYNSSNFSFHRFNAFLDMRCDPEYPFLTASLTSSFEASFAFSSSSCLDISITSLLLLFQTFNSFVSYISLMLFFVFLYLCQKSESETFIQVSDILPGKLILLLVVNGRIQDIYERDLPESVLSISLS